MKLLSRLFTTALCFGLLMSSAFASPLMVTAKSTFPAALPVGNNAAAVYTVTNKGTVGLYDIGVNALPGFITMTDNGCSAKNPLPAGDSCDITFSINSIAAGTSVLPSQNYPQIKANAGGVISYPVLPEQRFAVSASEPVPGLVATATQALPTNIADNTSHPVTVTFTNNSAVNLTNLKATLSDSDDFALTSDTCTSTLAIGANCAVSATYTAPKDTAGAVSLSISLVTAETNAVIQGIAANITDVAVDGATVIPSPAYTNEGASHFVSYHFKNDTALPATEVAVTVPTTPFTLKKNTCTAILGAGASCDILGLYKVPAGKTDNITFNATLSYLQGNDVSRQNVLPGNTSKVIQNAKVKCWGYNKYGQLGNATNNGTVDPNPAPLAVTDISNAVAITGGVYHTCALLSTGEVKCWGYNLYGQLGNTTNNGTDDPNPTPLDVTGMTNAVAITGGRYHTCALLSAGGVKCWGYNRYGQLGNDTNSGTDGPNPTPSAVTGMTNAVAITGGDHHTCALLSTGGVKCWGYNKYGQLGNTTNSGNNKPNPAPLDVTGMTNAVAITGGDYHTCALLSTGEVKCWGDNGDGQLGNDTNNDTENPNPTPSAIADMTNAVAITGGGYHTCALLSTGEVKCWGRNRFGELGNATNNGNNNPNPTPLDVTGMTNAVAITGGGYHTCALLSTGGVKCWGYNKYGQLGNTTNSGNDDPNPAPSAVTDISNAVAITGGDFHTCALVP